MEEESFVVKIKGSLKFVCEDRANLNWLTNVAIENRLPFKVNFDYVGCPEEIEDKLSIVIYGNEHELAAFLEDIC